jgi:quercetin dioxygenase-like cupin family protein
MRWLGLGAAVVLVLIAAACADGGSTDAVAADDTHAQHPDDTRAPDGAADDAVRLAASEPRIVRAGSSPTTLAGADLVHCIATAAQTGGGYSFLEIEIPAGSGPPPHEHPADEFFYILSGVASIQTGELRGEVGPGDYFHVPRDTPHAITAVEDVRLVAGYSPAGEENRLFCPT